jgi:hypothetical protein
VSEYFYLFTAAFSLEFLNKMYSTMDESVFPILEFQNNHPGDVVCVLLPF